MIATLRYAFASFVDMAELDDEIDAGLESSDVITKYQDAGKIASCL